jgi:hypothetical protein
LINNAKPDVVAVAKIKFRQIAMQVPFLAVLVDVLHAAFEDAVKALNPVRVDTRPPSRTYSS